MVSGYLGCTGALYWRGKLSAPALPEFPCATNPPISSTSLLCVSPTILHLALLLGKFAHSINPQNRRSSLHTPPSILPAYPLFTYPFSSRIRTTSTHCPVTVTHAKSSLTHTLRTIRTPAYPDAPHAPLVRTRFHIAYSRLARCIPRRNKRIKLLLIPPLLYLRAITSSSPDSSAPAQ